MTDVDMGGGGGAAAGFKLFGTVILKEPRQPKEEEEEGVAEAAKPAGVEEAAAAARGSPALACPRCRSRETKFCYFNNYNVNQPRHFCKACHRYWTAGGTLRNVPVGAGRRKARPPPTPASACRGVGAVAGGAWPYPER